jgi:hypothetical protein
MRGFIGISGVAVGFAIAFGVLGEPGPLPGLGNFPLLPATCIAAVSGVLSLYIVSWRGLVKREPAFDRRHLVWVLPGLGVLLAVPPIAIDTIVGFPHDINVALPVAILFYPAVGLVAEAAFHLVPLAALCLALPRRAPPLACLLPVVFIEPLFQMAQSGGGGQLQWLVFANVSLISGNRPA